MFGSRPGSATASVLRHIEFELRTPMQTVLRFSKIPLTIHKTRHFKPFLLAGTMPPSLDQTLSQWTPLLVLKQAYVPPLRLPEFHPDLRHCLASQQHRSPRRRFYCTFCIKVTRLVAVTIVVVIACHFRFIGDVRCGHCGARKRKVTEFYILWLLYTPSLSIRIKFGTRE